MIGSARIFLIFFLVLIVIPGKAAGENAGEPESGEEILNYEAADDASDTADDVSDAADDASDTADDASDAPDDASDAADDASDAADDASDTADDVSDAADDASDTADDVSDAADDASDTADDVSDAADDASDTADDVPDAAVPKKTPEKIISDDSVKDIESAEAVPAPSKTKALQERRKSPETSPQLKSAPAPQKSSARVHEEEIKGRYDAETVVRMAEEMMKGEKIIRDEDDLTEILRPPPQDPVEKIPQKQKHEKIDEALRSTAIIYFQALVSGIPEAMLELSHFPFNLDGHVFENRMELQRKLREAMRRTDMSRVPLYGIRFFSSTEMLEMYGPPPARLAELNLEDTWIALANLGGHGHLAVFRKDNGVWRAIAYSE